MKLKKFKGTGKFVLLLFSIYLFTMFFISAVVHDNPELIFTNQVKAEIINPFEPDKSYDDLTNYTEIFKQFEGFVMLTSVQGGGGTLHLMAVPDKSAQIYRNFSIYIFSNQPCFYEIKIDDQVFQRGYSEWKKVVRTKSDYNSINIKVTLVNMTNVTLQPFNFPELTILDSPWDAAGEGEGGPPIAEEWIRFSRLEFTNWVLARIAIDIGFALLGIMVGISMATISADYSGIKRVV